MLSINDRSGMKVSLRWWWALLFILVTGMANAVQLEREEQYISIVVPLLKDNCIKCHGVEKNKGKVTLHDIGIEIQNSKSVDLWARVLEEIKTGEMPPRIKEVPFTSLLFSALLSVNSSTSK